MELELVGMKDPYNFVEELVEEGKGPRLWSLFTSPVRDVVNVEIAVKEFTRLVKFFETGDSRRLVQVKELVSFLEERTNFFVCPASTKYHLCCPGGLLAHSIGVTRLALELREVLPGADKVPIPSIILTGLFHDLGKTGSMGAISHRRYVDNILKSGKVSDAQPYKYGDEQITMPVAVQSLYMVSKFVDLDEAEAQAILAHDGQFIPGNRDFAHNETPLALLLHFADYWCCRFLESGQIEYGHRGMFGNSAR